MATERELDRTQPCRQHACHGCHFPICHRRAGEIGDIRDIRDIDGGAARYESCNEVGVPCARGVDMRRVRTLT